MRISQLLVPLRGLGRRTLMVQADTSKGEEMSKRQESGGRGGGRAVRTYLSVPYVGVVFEQVLILQPPPCHHGRLGVGRR